MAHQTDVHVIKQNFEAPNPSEKVIDPVCGAEMERRSAKHVIFRGEDAIYFCSRDCSQRYLNPSYQKAKPAA